MGCLGVLAHLTFRAWFFEGGAGGCDATAIMQWDYTVTMPLVFFELDDINWYPSATPYQRACALTDIGEVFLMGPAVSIDGDLQSKVGLLPVRVSPRSHSFARVSGWVSPANVDSYARAAQSVLSECRYPVWICSTNVWVQRLAAGLKGRLGGCILVDVFDPVEFPREVAVLKRHWLSASWYWVKEHGAIRLLRHADIAIRATALDLTKEYGVSPDRIVAVLNGVRPSLLTHGLSAPVESSGLSTSETVKLGYVGQLDIQRGLGSFCSVVETLRRRGNRIEVHMVGPIAKGDEAVLASRFDPDGLWLHFRGPLKTDVAMDVLSA